jgi:6-pyruvoyltetrahydropterin/6-carboxytetrahydropterin synthase
MYQVVKTYGHDLGLSAVFRQHRATHSHCRFLHGYALSISFLFESETLDARNWTIDFGALKPIKEWLQSVFDHKLLIADDDPELDHLTYLGQLCVADVLVVPRVGCEGFAEFIHDHVAEWLVTEQLSPRVRLAEVRVSEHGANSAIYRPTSVLVSGQDNDVSF